MPNIGLPEIIIILIIVLLVFGPRRLPEMAKGIGQSVREFRKGIRDMKDEVTSDDEDRKPSKDSHVSTAKSEPESQKPVESTSAEKTEVKSA